MKYILDTHTWIWWNMNPRKLSAKVRSLIANTLQMRLSDIGLRGWLKAQDSLVQLYAPLKN